MLTSVLYCAYHVNEVSQAETCFFRPMRGVVVTPARDRLGAVRLFALSQLDLHFDRQDQGDFVLDRKNIVDGAIVAFGPKVRAILCVDQLSGDTDATAALANAALQNISHAELPRGFADIDRTPFVHEAGI